ncbi:MAG TPA: hypothetical protein VM008_15045 [Phycisphaerae bacterium]|nr:hypothetical protein [Phycisphaerae bacterium]
MNLHRFFCALGIAGALAGTSPGAFGLTAVVAGSGTIGLEVPGFNGQFQLSTINSNSFSGTATGLTSDGTSVARLVNSYSTSTVQRQIMGGAGSSTLNLGVKLDDIAYTNGALYGVVSRSDALQIVQINGDGTTTNVLTQPMTTYSGQWRLSGQTAGSELLAFRAASSSGVTLSPIAELVNPVGASMTALPVSASVISDTVINRDATAVTFIPTSSTFGSSPFANGAQTREQLPTGIPMSALSSTQAYGSSVGSLPLSDEFNYSWDPASHNALVTTSISTTTASSWGKLYRTPFVWTGNATASMTNGVTPDGTVLSNVQSIAPFMVTGPTAMQQVLTPQAPGSFGARALGTANLSVDLNGASRGVYTVNTLGPVTADYAHGGTTDVGRAVDIKSGGALSFAYDPISANIIGNGDFELSGYGWDNVTNPSFVTSTFVIQDGLTGNHVPWFTGSETIRQILQEPTANSPMLLSFDYRLDPFPGGTFALDVTLAGEEVAHVDMTTPSSTYSHYSVLITDPALENLSAAEFRVQMTSGGSAWAYLDNFSLTAVPEPGTGILMAIPALLAWRRRGARRRMSH